MSSHMQKLLSSSTVMSCIKLLDLFHAFVIILRSYAEKEKSPE